MRYSQLFGKTVKTVSKDIKLPSHRFLHQGGFIRQISTGRYALLPLGFKVWRKIYQIIQAEMEAIGCQQLVTPTLHPIEYWQQTNRDQAFGDEMLTVEDHHGATFVVGATAEGMMVELVKKFAPSYKDLPIIVYQLSSKFRDEKRPRGGLLRTREFMMKDAYSFTATEKDSLEWYRKFYEAYVRLTQKFGFEAVPALSSSGALGGDYNHEFMVKNENGEGLFYECADCGFAMTEDYIAEKKIKDTSICPKCGRKKLLPQKGIEWGHVFKQDHFYTRPHQGYFVDQDGKQKPLWMGAYGIGLGRTLATIVETHHDDKGIIWPESVAPYHIHLIGLANETGDLGKVEEIHRQLTGAGLEVLFDDRKDVSAGEKFADADLIGCPNRMVVSKKTLAKGSVEVKKRDFQENNLVPLRSLVEIFSG